jgi:ComF family protein
MRLTAILEVISDPLLTLTYPHACLICGASVEHRRFGNCCESCWLETRLFSEKDHLCWKCGMLSLSTPLESAVEIAFCHRCGAQPFAMARAIGLYSGALRETVLNLKRQPHIPAIVLEHLASAVARLSLAANTLIVPVPLHVSRERERGFNQSIVIARAVSEQTGLPIAEGVLARSVHSEKYRAGLDVKGRHDTVARSFSVVHPRVILGEYVLLVDDVFTTGATVAACTEELLAAGARGVSVFTIARSRY